MKKKLIFYTVALTAGLLTACSSDDDQETPIRHISVEVNEQPMTSADDEAGARSLTTRSAITTTESFTKFYMRGVYDGSTSEYEASKEDNKWTVAPDTWPGGTSNNDPTPFYAFTDGTFNANSGTPYISFTMAEDASTQHDLLVAKNTVFYNNHQGKVPLTFDHACAALAFNVYITNTLKTALGSTLTVNSIVLRNVSNTGKYYFGETPTWGDVSGSAYYTLTDGDITVDNTPQALRSNYLFVIPQTRAANDTTGTYLEINYTFSGQKKTSATIPLAVNWAAGSKYTIDIKLGTGLIQ
jgi:hypothetical protein